MSMELKKNISAIELFNKPIAQINKFKIPLHFVGKFVHSIPACLPARQNAGGPVRMALPGGQSRAGRLNQENSNSFFFILKDYQRILIISFLLLSGCGFYSFTGSLPPHIKTISIPVFVNETAEFGVAEDITDGVTAVFIEENILKVVDTENAHSVVRGTIKKLTTNPILILRLKKFKSIDLT